MDELRQGNRGAESTKGRRLREALVVAQVALALILMTQVGLIGRTTWKLHHLDKGFDPAQLLTLRMNLAETGYRDPAVAHDFYTRALERIQAVPGVMSAGTSSAASVCRSRGERPFFDSGQAGASTRFEASGRARRHQRRLPQDNAHADRARPWTSFARTSRMRHPWRSSAVKPRADTGLARIRSAGA